MSTLLNTEHLFDLSNIQEANPLTSSHLHKVCRPSQECLLWIVQKLGDQNNFTKEWWFVPDIVVAGLQRNLEIYELYYIFYGGNK